jgi:hypothetical protein
MDFSLRVAMTTQWRFTLVRAKVNGFKTLMKKLMIFGPRTHHQNFSLQFEVNLGSSSMFPTAEIIAIVFLSASFDSGRFSSN